MTGGQASKPETALVGIGASAGGLDGLKQFFSCTPGDSGLAYVVVVHLMPEQPSLLADLLQPFVGMPIQQVSEYLLVEPDNVYVIPPGHNLATIDSHLRISDLESQRRHRAPIDQFFETLAKTHGEQALTTADDFAPEVVILDIGLPDMDGYALANALRARPQTADALLIAVSGYGQDSDIDKSRAAGIDHHLTKPAHLHMLLELIGRWRAATPSR